MTVFNGAWTYIQGQKGVPLQTVLYARCEQFTGDRNKSLNKQAKRKLLVIFMYLSIYELQQSYLPPLDVARGWIGHWEKQREADTTKIEEMYNKLQRCGIHMPFSLE